MKRPASGARRKSVTKTSLKKKGGKIDKNTLKQVDKVEVVKVLVAKYGLSNIDALVAYDKFFKKYPTGVIKKAEFMEEYKVRIMFSQCLKFCFFDDLSVPPQYLHNSLFDQFNCYEFINCVLYLG